MLKKCKPCSGMHNWAPLLQKMFVRSITEIFPNAKRIKAWKALKNIYGKCLKNGNKKRANTEKVKRSPDERHTEI